MSHPAGARHVLDYFWQGPPTLSQPLRLEWRFVAIRWLGIIFVAPALLLAHLTPARLAAAYLVLFLAGVYNLSVQVMMRRRPGMLASGYFTTIGDGLLNIAMIVVGGGFDSPFYYLLFTVSISAAMRYGYGPSLATVLLFVSLDFWQSSTAVRVLDELFPFFFRSGFLALTAVLAGYLREQAQRAEVALQERLRQANLLNEASAMLGASLEFETVLRNVAAGACHLFGAAYAVVQPLTESGTDTDAPALVYHPAPMPAPSHLHRALAALCSDQRAATRPARGSLLAYQRLPSSDQRAVVLPLALPTRPTALARLALSLPYQDLPPALDADILASFVERTTLAIENASLYRALASRTHDLQRAYADLATAHQELLGVDEMKTNFLANVSHELRTPLSSIRSFSELLLSYDDPAVQQEFLYIINAESERLTRLVNDVLDITKIEAGYIDWDVTEVEIGPLISNSARTFAPLIEAQGLVFQRELDEPLPTVYADCDRLQQVIANLLNNAIKFTTRGTIGLSATRVDAEIHIRVTDTGIGIAPEDQRRIFEKFQQVGDTLTDKPRGTGLGLAICRDIIAYHQGRLWVESQPGVGSSFTIALPIPSAPAPVQVEAVAVA